MLWVEDVKILYVVEHDLISQPFSPVIGGAGLFRSWKKTILAPTRCSKSVARSTLIISIRELRLLRCRMMIVRNHRRATKVSVSVCSLSNPKGIWKRRPAPRRRNENQDLTDLPRVAFLEAREWVDGWAQIECIFFRLFRWIYDFQFLYTFIDKVDSLNRNIDELRFQHIVFYFSLPRSSFFFNLS